MQGTLGVRMIWAESESGSYPAIVGEGAIGLLDDAREALPGALPARTFCVADDEALRVEVVGKRLVTNGFVMRYGEADEARVRGKRGVHVQRFDALILGKVRRDRRRRPSRTRSRRAPIPRAIPGRCRPASAQCAGAMKSAAETGCRSCRVV